MRKTGNELVGVNVRRTGPDGATVFAIVIPYDSETGQVFLNAVAGDRMEADHNLSAIELSEEEANRIEMASAEVVLLEDAEAVGDLFPVCVPLHLVTGRPCLAAIGSSDAEARVNLDFLNEEQDDYVIAPAGIRMPQMIRVLDGNVIAAPDDAAHLKI